MEFFTQVFADMWQNLLNFESGFITLFLGAGALLFTIVMSLVNAFSDPS